MSFDTESIRLPGTGDMEMPIVRTSPAEYRAAGRTLVEAAARRGVGRGVLVDVLAAAGITRESATPCPGTLGRLQCNQPAGHEFGCTFESETGSAVDDHHADGGHG